MRVTKDFFRNIALVCLAASWLTPAFAQNQPDQRARRTLALRRLATRGYLGVGVIELTEDRVKALNLKDDKGVEVKLVDENSPAAKAGLKEGDVILEVNGKPVEGLEQFTRSIGETKAGTKVNLSVWRNGAKQDLVATVDSRPQDAWFGDLNFPIPPVPPIPPNILNPFPDMPGSSARVGFEGEGLSPQLAEFFGVKEGVLVRTVNPKTPAEKAGLKAGDVVVKVNGTPVTSAREISGLVRASRKKTVSFGVVRNKKEILLNVEIAEDRVPAGDRLVL